MTAPSPDTLLELASRLTKAQRLLFERLEAVPHTAEQFFYRTGERFGSSRMGVVASLSPHLIADEVGQFGRSSFETGRRGYVKLTPLGVALREHLAQAAKETPA